MVGHTGDFSAAVRAVECVDDCLGEIVSICRSLDYKILIIADHGNADIMKNPDGSPHTAHTTNLVPIILISNSNLTISNGKLADVAPTILNLLDLEVPEEMTGNQLSSTVPS